MKDPWCAKLIKPKIITIKCEDKTDKILCFTYDTINIYLGHESSKISVFLN